MIIKCDDKTEAALDGLDAGVDRVHARVLHYIIKQKDEIIAELHDKVKLLYNHINLLQELKKVDLPVTTPANQNIDKNKNGRNEGAVINKDGNTAEKKASTAVPN